MKTAATASIDLPPALAAAGETFREGLFRFRSSVPAGTPSPDPGAQGDSKGTPGRLVPRPRRSGIMAVCLLVTVLSGSLLAQQTPPRPQSADPQWWFGFHLFEMLFKQRGLVPLTNVQRALASTPEETVLVILGGGDDMSFLDVSRFVRDGGAVLYATDHTATMRNLGFLQRGPIVASSPEAAYHGFPDCPRMTDLVRDHFLMRGVNQLILNRCGRITRLSGAGVDWQVLGTLPDRQGDFAQPLSIIAAGEVRETKGKIAVISDHSLLTNGMLWHGDNAIFAVNLCQWLSESGRKRFLFLDNGRVGSGPLPPPELPQRLPPPPESMPELTREEMVTFTNKLLTGLEDADVFNELATNRLPFLSDAVYARSLMILLATVVALWLLSRLGSSQVLQAAPLPVRGMPTVADLKIRQRAAAGEFEQAARVMARDFLGRLTGSSHTDGLPWSISPRDVELRGHLALRSSFRWDLTRILQVANSDQLKIDRSEFQSLLDSVRRLDRLWREGSLLHPDFVSPPLD